MHPLNLCVKCSLLLIYRLSEEGESQSEGLWWCDCGSWLHSSSFGVDRPQSPTDSPHLLPPWKEDTTLGKPEQTHWIRAQEFSCSQGCLSPHLIKNKKKKPSVDGSVLLWTQSWGAKWLFHLDTRSRHPGLLQAKERIYLKKEDGWFLRQNTWSWPGLCMYCAYMCTWTCNNMNTTHIWSDHI